MLGLVDRVLHAFEPDHIAVAAVMARAIASRKDGRIGGGGAERVDHDAVLAAQAGPLAQAPHSEPRRSRPARYRREIPGRQRCTDVKRLLALERLDAGLEEEAHAGIAMLLLIEGGKLRRHRAGHDAIQRLEHRDLEPELGRDGRNFQTDIAAADDRQPGARRHRGPQCIDIGDAAQIMHSGQFGAGNRNLAYAGAGRQQQLVVGEAAPVGERDGPGRAVDCRRGNPQHQLSSRPRCRNCRA